MPFCHPWAAAARLCATLALAAAPAFAFAASGEADNASTKAPGAGEAIAPQSMPASADLGYRSSATLTFMGLPLSLHGRTTTRWRLKDGHYEAQLHIDTVGFDQVSRGQLAPDGALAPDRYEEKRPFHEAEFVDIDWAHGRIRFGAAGEPVPAPPQGAQDRLSLQFELARLMQRYPQRFVAGTTHTVKLIGTHDVDTWNFLVDEDNSVETGRGAMHAVHFSARRTVGKVQETMDVWLGAELHWLPVRIRIVDRKGAVIDSVLADAVLP